MSPSLAPFSQAQQNFQTQLGQFDQFAQQGFPLSNFLTTSAQQTGTSPTQNVGWLDGLKALGNLVAGVNKAGTTGFSITRLVAGLLGLLLITGAIFLFSIESVDAALDSSVGRKVKRAGELLA